MKQYDVIVIGSGAAAQTVAERVRAAGWATAIVDERPFGGTCELRGCDPKKVLMSGAEAVDLARRLHGHGVAGEIRIDWAELMAFKRSFTEPVPERLARHFAEIGIDALQGHARFTAPDTIALDGQTLQSRFFVIATGNAPVPLEFPGAEHVVGSDVFLDLDRLPRRLVLVGGGYIAAELSHLAARAGAEVHVLQRRDRLLPTFDSTLVGWLDEKFRAVGIDVRLRTAVERIERDGEAFAVRIKGDGGSVTLAADLVVHAAGRAPALGGLNLAGAGIETEGGRLRLNEFLQSVSNPKVYAAGDAAAKGPPLTPVASHDGKVVAANLLEGNRHRPNYAAVPSVVFTIPPLARVGLSETEARAQGLKFTVKSEHTGDWYSSRRLAERVSGFKVLIEEPTGFILGAHLLGPHADEVINLFALTMRQRLPASALKDTIFGYPTGASDVAHMV
ncbi:MAG TPA: NAD(P)/FAD-dependent oxidoreductase [Alphaproteobacteria bacterium]